MFFLAYEDQSGLRVVASDVQGHWRSEVQFVSSVCRKTGDKLVVDPGFWPPNLGLGTSKKILPFLRTQDLNCLRNLLKRQLIGFSLTVCDGYIQIIDESSHPSRERMEIASVWLNLAGQYLSRKKASIRA